MTNLKVFCGGLLVLSSSAFAEPFEKLLVEAKKETVFRQDTQSTRCPRFIKVVESNKYLPDYAKLGDQKIFLSTNVPGQTENGYFTHENNDIFFRPGLSEGKTHTIHRDVDASLVGVGYRKASQHIANGVLTSIYSAKIASVAMIASIRSSVSYDSNRDTISYFFAGNGIEDVNCLFRKVE